MNNKDDIRRDLSQALHRRVSLKDIPFEGEPFSFDTDGPRVASIEELESWYEMFGIDKSISITIPIFNKMKELGHVKIVKENCYQQNLVRTSNACSNYDPDPDFQFGLCQDDGFVTNDTKKNVLATVYYATISGEIIVVNQSWWAKPTNIRKIVEEEIYEVIGQRVYERMLNTVM